MNFWIIAFIVFVVVYGWAMAAVLGWRLYSEKKRWDADWKSAQDTLAQARRANEALVRAASEQASFLVQFSEALVDVMEHADLLEVPPEVMAFVDISWLRIPAGFRKHLPKARKALAKVKKPKKARGKKEGTYFD